MRPLSPYSTCTTPHGQRGLSLVELMISLTIGMILLLGISALIAQQSSTRDELEKSSQQIENGRYAMQLLHNDIEHAGYYGTLNPSTFAQTTPDPCGLVNSGWSTGVLSAATAIGTTAVLPLTCLPNQQPNTGILVVRRVDTNAVDKTTIVGTTDTYMQTSLCSTEAAVTPFALSTNTAAFNLHQNQCANVVQTVNKYYVRIYYISSCDVCLPAPDNIPTLKVVENADGNPAPTPLSLVEGIENMQFDYGVDGDGDGYPDSYCTDPDNLATCTAPPPPAPAPSHWPDVMAVRVDLLARNTECTFGYADTKTYNLGRALVYTPGAVPGNGVCPNGVKGDYKRHVFSELVRVTNPSIRRARS